MMQLKLLTTTFLFTHKKLRGYKSISKFSEMQVFIEKSCRKYRYKLLDSLFDGRLCNNSMQTLG